MVVVGVNDQERNAARLVAIAERQHTDRIRDIDALNQKIGVLLGAQAVVLAGGAKLSWCAVPARIGLLWAMLALVTLASGVLGLSVRAFKDTPEIEPFWTNHAGKPPGEFDQQLLSNYASAIRENRKRNKRKGNCFNVGLGSFFFTALLFALETFLEGRMP